MKKIIKAFIIGMLLSLMVTASASAAKPSSVTVKRAYASYVKKYLSSSRKYPYGSYTLYDINRDGVPEMFFQYAWGRYAFKIYTYRNRKVVPLKSVTGGCRIYYKSSKKQICILTSSGFADNTYTCYKLINNKLKKVVEYKSENHTSFDSDFLNIKFYKNGKRISKRSFIAVTNSIDKWNGIEWPHEK